MLVTTIGINIKVRYSIFMIDWPSHVSEENDDRRRRYNHFNENVATGQNTNWLQIVFGLMNAGPSNRGIGHCVTVKES